MSDEILTITTPYGDVAELAQGYINRVDGERILLPLPLPSQEGAGVRYVVHLADGTPAFAGAGRCVQVSDQGDTVPPHSRFETLVDSLQFDERSQPVYEYIVAIRNQAYSQQGADAAPAEEGGEAVAVDVDAVEVAEGEVSAAEVADAGDYAVADVADEGDYAVADAGDYAVADEGDYAVADEGDYAVADEGDYAVAEPGVEVAAPSAFETLDDPSQAVADEGYAAAAQAAVDAGEAPELVPSVRPEAIPTGILERPARAVHWAPSPPRRPTPRPASGLFNYNGGGLPAPARPPYPEIDPAYFVQRAPHPSAAAAVAVAAAPDAYAEAGEAYAEPYAEVEDYEEQAAPPPVPDSFAPEASPAAEGYQEDLTVVAEEGYGEDEGYVEEATVVADEGYEQALVESVEGTAEEGATPEEEEVAVVDLDSEDDAPADDDESQGW